jgi:hypothetical protein
MSDPATLDAYRLPGREGLTAWCAHCRRWHLHGAVEGEQTVHRCAHCCFPGSPYTEDGYFLRVVGPAPGWVVKDRQRRRPRGREAAE